MISEVTIGKSQNYILYSNGRCYTKRFKRFKVKNVFEVKGRKYSRYRIDENHVHINRLVMFHFGQHNYDDIYKMPNVSPIDGDYKNNKIANLKFTA